MTERDSANEIRITRVYDAPLRAVWDAWTDLAQVAKWWGPRGFTITTHSKDLRPGGTWRYTMHGPDGVDYPNVTRYLEVEPLRRLVYDHGGTDDRPPLFRVTANFAERRGRTTLDLVFALSSPEAAQTTARFIKQVGGNATWDRLAEHLEDVATGRPCFVVNRSFEAPLARVVEHWSRPERLARWAPPLGPQRLSLRPDDAPEGETRFVLEGDGVRAAVRFAEEPHAQTRVTVTQAPPDAEAASFVRGRAGMTAQWSTSFDALDALLAGDDAVTSELMPPRLMHGTKAVLKPGDLIEAGRPSNYGARRPAAYVYVTATLDAAIWGAELAAGDGRARIYTVEPTGPCEDDPNLTDKKFPGNPTKSYRTRHPLRVTGEVTAWEGHAPAQLQAMRDHLARLAAQGVEAIED